LGKVLEPLLAPSFATYNICREYGVKYSIDIEVVGTGKGEKIKGEIERGGITVLGCSDEVRDRITGQTRQDEQAGDALPGYAEAVDEDPDADDDAAGQGTGAGTDEKAKGGHGRGLSRFLGGSREKDRERENEGGNSDDEDLDFLPAYSR
jgi:hypothetical protein